MPVGAGLQPIDDREDLLGPTGVEQVDRALALKQRMGGVQPAPRLVRRVKVRQPFNHEPEVRDHRLDMQRRRPLPVTPAGDRGWRDVDDVGDVRALQTASALEVTQDLGDRGLTHGRIGPRWVRVARSHAPSPSSSVGAT